MKICYALRLLHVNFLRLDMRTMVRLRVDPDDSASSSYVNANYIRVINYVFAAALLLLVSLNSLDLLLRLAMHGNMHVLCVSNTLCIRSPIIDWKL